MYGCIVISSNYTNNTPHSHHRRPHKTYKAYLDARMDACMEEIQTRYMDRDKGTNTDTHGIHRYTDIPSH